MSEVLDSTVTCDSGIGLRAVVQRAVDAYRMRFGGDPASLAFAPGRVNLIGDHTDYAQGLAMPAALTIGCVCAVGPRRGMVSAVSADIRGEGAVSASEPIEPVDLDGLPGWVRYAAGTFEMMRRRFAPGADGANIAVASDVPAGSGLSSSAALEVSIATALCGLWGIEPAAMAMALACQAAEHRYAGAPCGLMDQMVSLMGRREHALRIDFADASARPVALPAASDAAFVLFDSAVKHANDDGGYAARRAACESVLPKLGVASLRAVTMGDLSRIPAALTPAEMDATRHVVTENDRVDRFADALVAGRYDEAGSHMSASHVSLSRVYRVSCPQVDRLVEIATAHPGVFGARMTGGGFGGWAVALVQGSEVATVTASVIERYHAETGLRSAARVVRAGDGARRLTLGPEV